MEKAIMEKAIMEKANETMETKIDMRARVARITKVLKRLTTLRRVKRKKMRGSRFRWEDEIEIRYSDLESYVEEIRWQYEPYDLPDMGIPSILTDKDMTAIIRYASLEFALSRGYEPSSFRDAIGFVKSAIRQGPSGIMAEWGNIVSVGLSEAFHTPPVEVD
jgi:hypothetical protein